MVAGAPPQSPERHRPLLWPCRIFVVGRRKIWISGNIVAVLRRVGRRSGTVNGGGRWSMSVYHHLLVIYFISEIYVLGFRKKYVWA